MSWRRPLDGPSWEEASDGPSSGCAGRAPVGRGVGLPEGRPARRGIVARRTEGWAVTAWGERYEVFAETDALVAGESATSNAHVTVLAGFAPLEKGAVTLVLRGAGGAEEAFRQEKPKRSGIFAVEAKPRAEGTFDLVFRIESAAGPEEIAAGRVRVGSAAAPGGLVAEESPAAADAVSFLKEQQWRTEFATAWVEEGALGDSVEGPARVTVAGGGEVVLTAGVDATVAPSPWPHPGLDVAAGGTVFRLVPRVGDRSLPGAARGGLVARGRRRRGAAARRAARRAAASRGHQPGRAGEGPGGAFRPRGPARLGAWRRGGDGGARRGGRVRRLRAPGPVGGPRGRGVRVSRPDRGRGNGARATRPRPPALDRGGAPSRGGEPRPGLAPGPLSQATRPAGPRRDRGGEREARLAIAPGGSPDGVGRRHPRDRPLRFRPAARQRRRGGDRAPRRKQRGVVAPLSAVLDDCGTSRRVRPARRARASRAARCASCGASGTDALVEGLRPGERLVTRGAAAVRRSSLLSAGAPEGHVH